MVMIMVVVARAAVIAAGEAAPTIPNSTAIDIQLDPNRRNCCAGSLHIVKYAP